MKLFLALLLVGSAQAAEYRFSVTQTDPGPTDHTGLGRFVISGTPGSGLSTFSMEDGTLERVDFFFDPSNLPTENYSGSQWGFAPVTFQQHAVVTFVDGVFQNLTYRVEHDDAFTFTADQGVYWISGKGWGSAWRMSAPSPVPEPETYALLLAGLALLRFRGRFGRTDAHTAQGSTPPR